MDFLIQWWPAALFVVSLADAEAGLLTSILLAAAAITGTIEPSIVSALGALTTRWLIILASRRSLLKTLTQKPSNPYTITEQGYKAAELVRTWLKAQIPADYPHRRFWQIGQAVPVTWASAAISVLITVVWYVVWVSAGGLLLGDIIADNGWLIPVRENLLGYCLLCLIAGTVLRMIVHRLRVRCGL